MLAVEFTPRFLNEAPTPTLLRYLGVDSVKSLHAEERTEFISLYNNFAQVWNSHETDRSKTLFSTYNGIGFYTLRRQKRLICDLTWCNLTFVAGVLNWDTWVNNGWRGPFLREQLRMDALISLSAFQPVKSKLNPNVQLEMQEAQRRIGLPLERGSRGRD